MYLIGLDIGTTSISAIIYSLKAKKIEKSVTISNDSFISSQKKGEFIQSPQRILELGKKIIDEFIDEYSDIKAIGVTGQMHGIVYYDENGRPVSPLYTWQDRRGEEILSTGRSACEEIFNLTGYSVPSGYGFATHYYNMKNDLVPKSAKGLCTIHDLVVMNLCGLTKSIMHSSDGASLGLYNLENNNFDTKALKTIGIEESFLPKITIGEEIAGYYRGIPVGVALGDNQASFLGSVSDIEEGLLINVGTGSQVSCVTPYRKDVNLCEIRPFVLGKYLAVGCALCGGRAYSILEKFFRSYSEFLGIKGVEQYSVMEKIVSNIDADDVLKVNTSFSGSRQNPNLCGNIDNINTQNFTPANLILGFINGILKELFDMSLQADVNHNCKKLIGSGNGIRKNKVMIKQAEKMFNNDLKIPYNAEEASMGAMLFGAVASGEIKNFKEAGKLIKYI